MPLIVIGDPHPQKRRAVSNKTPKEMTKQASRLVSQNFMVPKGRKKKKDSMDHSKPVNKLHTRVSA